MSSEIISASKKRALEALERRFSTAKPELPQKPYQKQRKREKIKKEEGETETPSTSNKGNFIFQGKSETAANPSKDNPEVVHPAYQELSLSAHRNLIKQHPENERSGVVVVNNIIHDLLQNGDASEKYLQGSRNMKIDNWILLDNHVSRSDGLEDARIRSLKVPSKRSKKFMSLRQHRALGSFELKQNFRKFELFKPMHEMWKEYVLKLLDEPRKHLGQVFLSADLHGAYMIVVECKGGNFNGVRGIMIRETKETFGIITPDDKFKVVVKKLCVFQLQAANFKVTMLGDKLSARNIS